MGLILCNFLDRTIRDASIQQAVSPESFLNTAPAINVLIGTSSGYLEEIQYIEIYSVLMFYAPHAFSFSKCMWDNIK